MSDELILGLIGFVAGLIAVVTPIIKLNSNIVKLNTTLSTFRVEYEKENAELKLRVGEHGRQIDTLEKTAISHDHRISTLEKRSDAV